jgi:alkylation response protein AidB-like acyl-CoA dehydrogenase
MYNLHLAPEQLEIRDTVRDFVTRKVKPIALRADRLEAREKPLLRDALDQASQLGLRTLALAEDNGGTGADRLTCCIVAEEIAVADPDIASVLAQTSMLAHLMFDSWMAPSQRDRFLPQFLADDRYHLALARHEPESDDALGIDYHRPKTIEAPKTIATHSGDWLIINGHKDRVANAPLAKLFAVEAGIGSNGVIMLLLPRETSGLHIKDGDIEDSDQGPRWYHGARGELILDNCRVPAENLLDRNALAGDALGDSTLNQAINLGIGRAAYEAALDYAQLRVQGGRRLIEHQAIGTKLAEMAVRLDVARTAIWRAAWAADHPAAFADRSLPDLPVASIARVFSSEAIYRAAKDAAECFGAMGVMRDMPLQKYVHDALVCLHAERGNGEAKLRIAEAVADYRRPAIIPARAAE